MAPTALVRWLATLDADRLGEILDRRAEVHRPPVPADLAELADRLSLRGPVVDLSRTLPQPALQVLEAWQALAADDDPDGDRDAGVSRAALAESLGCADDDPDLAATLRVLAQRALAWPDPDSDRVHVPEPLRYAFTYPLALGRPYAVLLGGLTVADLRRIAARWDRRPLSLKAAVLADLIANVPDPDRIRATIAAAPAATRLLLGGMAAHRPVLYAEDGFGYDCPPEIAWALDHGLLLTDGWQLVELPREVALALRGEDWRAPFTPEPPLPALTPADPDAVRREASAAATAALDGFAAVVEACARTPVALRKQGGVGVREVRRLARAAGCEEPDVRLWLDLAAAAGLLAVAEGEALVTGEYDEWRADEPARRLAEVLRAWWEMPALPAYETTAEPRPAPLGRDPMGPAAAEVRRVQLCAVGDLPAGQGAAEVPTALVRWYAPVPVGEFADAEAAVAGLWREAHRLGVLAHGAVSPLGRALAEGREPELVNAARALLTPPASTAVFQADLTAVVAGSPSPALAELLDGCADREARGAASTWRFSAGSVRRALDAGADADALLAALRAAAGRALPQPLEYLFGDVARRHGAVRVRAVACVLHCADPALLAELAAVRALAPLRLHPIAPAVLGSALPPAETLAALRAAGYAPVGEDASGAPVVERAPQRRATPRVRRVVPGARAARTPEDPAAMAAALLATPLPADRGLSAATGNGDPLAAIARRAPHLSAGEVRLLAHAMANGTAVRIRYTNARGVTSARVIDPLDLDGHLLEAWCHLRDDERMFSLDRIDEVSPV